MAHQLRDSLLYRELDDELLILDREARLVHQLNRTASFIWRRHGEGCERPALAAAYAREFGVDETTAAEDVESTLSRLQALKLLHPEAVGR